MDDQSLFGRWLQRRRRALDLTQRELAARVGCSAATIRKLEADERRPSKRVATALAGTLGVGADELDAFVRFARNGWSDVPPHQLEPALERPWALGPREVGRPTAEPVWPDPPTARADEDPAETGPHRPASGGSAAARFAPPSERFVARRAELERLSAELATAFAGETRLVTVTGEAGQGKSALLRAFAAVALRRHPEAVIASGTCNAYVGAGDPFLPFREILAQLVGAPPVGVAPGILEAARAGRLWRAAPAGRAVLDELGPHALAALLPNVPDRRDPRAWRATPDLVTASGFGVPEEAVRAEACAALCAIALRTPLLVLLDDLQWVDRSSAELLLHLVRTGGAAPLLVVGAYRGSEAVATEGGGRSPLGTILRELERVAGHSVVDLADADARGFLDAYLDGEPNDLGPDFRDAMWRQTAGQPLLTVELLRELVERGSLRRDGAGRWHVVGELRWDAMPKRVAGALAQRVARVAPSAREVLRVGSIEGDTFTAEVVARVLGTDPLAVARSLGELAERHRLVSFVGISRVAGRTLTLHRFRHDLIRRFVYDGVAQPERRYLHAAVARALEELHGEAVDPGLMARHLLDSAEPGRAALHLRRAGDRARRAGALEEAIGHYESAAEHAEHPDPRWRADLLAALGECLWLRARLERALVVLEEAREAYAGSGDEQRTGGVELTIARVLFERGERGAAQAAFRRALDALERGPEGPVLARAVSCISQLHMVAHESAEAVAWGERALAIAERTGARDVTVHALNNVGTALAASFPARREEGLALLERSYALARQLGLVYDACRAAYNLANLHVSLADPARGRALFRELETLAAEHQIFAMKGAALLGLWAAEWRAGEWSRAFEAWTELDGVIAAAEPGSLKGTTVALLLAGAENDLGRPEAAWAYLAPFLEAYESMVEPQTRVLYLRERMRHAIGVGDDGAADRYARSLVELAGAGELVFDGLAQALRDAARWWLREPAVADPGGPNRAAQGACVEALASAGAHLGHAEGEATVAEGRAFGALAAGAHLRAARGFEEAAAAWRRGSMPLDEGRALVDAARAFALGGAGDLARASRERAAAIVERLARQIPRDGVAERFRETLDVEVPTLQGGRSPGRP